MSYDISKLIEWQGEGHRQVDIKIGSSSSSCKQTEIWVYDFTIGTGTGMFLSDPDQNFDLQKLFEDGERAKLEELLKKYK